MSMRRTFPFLVLLLCCLIAVAAAAGDSPLPLVGRISLVDGGLTARPGASGEWTEWGVNHPVAAGMSLRTSAHGQAMVQTGDATLALGPTTEIGFLRLDSGAMQIALRRGRIALHLTAFDARRNIEIDLARGGVWLLAAGEYDIAAGDGPAPARLGVSDGQARFVGERLDTTVTPGSPSPPSGADPVVGGRDGMPADDFIRWFRSARHDAPDGETVRRVSAAMTGWQMLDGNGSWETVDGFGAVWFPSAAAVGTADWVPYRYGHWRWIAPWGWTWIDDKEWGFAPSHYGRWARFPGAEPHPLDADPEGAAPAERWGWVPGPPTAPALYVPAAVAFLGTAGVGISYPDATGPAVAWFPLAPGEAYWPSYSDDPETIRLINAGAAPDLVVTPGADGTAPADVVNDDYRNRRFASVVPRAAFLAGRPVAAALIGLPARRLDNAPLLAGSPGLAPDAPAAPRVVVSDRSGKAVSDTARRAAAARVLARILAARHATTAPHAAVLVHAVPGRPAVVTTARPPAGGRAMMLSARRGAPRLSTGAKAAVAHPAHRPLRLAAMHRR
jgi:hypothetical protein